MFHNTFEKRLCQLDYCTSISNWQSLSLQTAKESRLKLNACETVHKRLLLILRIKYLMLFLITIHFSIYAL